MKSIAHRGQRFSALHVVIVALSLTMTIGAWLYSKHQVDLQIEARFDDARERAIGLIVDRMSRYEDALWSGVAKIDAGKGHLGHDEWRAFSASLNIPEKYPGVNGIGVIYHVPRTDFQAFMDLRSTEERSFAIYPEHALDDLLPITFIEPEAANAAAVGLDMAHETNRRTGLLASRDTGTAQITGPIYLVQDSGHTPGFLFYTPFYDGGATPATLQDRQEKFAGVVYAPFVVQKLVEGLLSKDLREVRFSIRDGVQTIYDEHSRNEPLRDDNPMFSETVELDMYGRNWVVDIRTNLAFRARNASEQPTLILLGGLIIEILVISMLVMLAQSNKRAHDYAQRLTEELRTKSENLEHANAEIEQFVYIASHDLKTPVRGIGFLADALEEDLEEVIGPIDQQTEIKMHIDLIRDRVGRMNDLTKGIMEFSRVGNYGNHDEPDISIGAIVADCLADFEVSPSQITVEAEVDRIACDSHNFRRVLENLIGNAFKYHDRRGIARVWLRIAEIGDRLQVSVRDDGPGIAPEFHEKIFEVFQTLRKAGDPESTGIGLAIVRKAVQRHGFDIQITSADGQGTEFAFDWPRNSSRETLITEKVA